MRKLMITLSFSKHLAIRYRTRVVVGFMVVLFIQKLDAYLMGFTHSLYLELLISAITIFIIVVVTAYHALMQGKAFDRYAPKDKNTRTINVGFHKVAHNLVFLDTSKTSGLSPEETLNIHQTLVLMSIEAAIYYIKSGVIHVFDDDFLEAVCHIVLKEGEITGNTAHLTRESFKDYTDPDMRAHYRALILNLFREKEIQSVYESKESFKSGYTDDLLSKIPKSWYSEIPKDWDSNAEARH